MLDQFDSSKFYLGVLCPHEHRWNGTDYSLRYLKGRHGCRQCRCDRGQADYQQNPEKYRFKAQQYRQANLEACRERERRYSRENPDVNRRRSANYRRNSPEKCKANQRRYREKNREAIRAKNQRWQRLNPDKVRQKAIRYYYRHLEALRSRSRAYFEQNADRMRAYNREYLKARYRSNPGYYIFLSDRRRRRLDLATPAWVNWQSIEAVYKESFLLSRRTGEPYHVDHIDPLQSDLICGFHVASNLQVLLASENRKKQNRFTPYGIDSNGSYYELSIDPAELRAMIADFKLQLDTPNH